MAGDGKRKRFSNESSSSGEYSDGADARVKGAKTKNEKNFIPARMLYGDKMEIISTESANEVGSRTKRVKTNDGRVSFTPKNAEFRHQKSMSMSSTDSSGNREKDGSGQEGDSEGEEGAIKEMHRRIIAAKGSKVRKKRIYKKEIAMDVAEEAAIKVLSKLNLGYSDS